MIRGKKLSTLVKRLEERHASVYHDGPEGRWPLEHPVESPAHGAGEGELAPLETLVACVESRHRRRPGALRRGVNRRGDWTPIGTVVL